MNRFKNILVAFDGSVDSIHALQVAETLANDNLARFTVAYVHDRPTENNHIAPPIDILSETYVGPGPVPTRPVPTHTNNKQKADEREKTEQVLSSAKSSLLSDIDVNYEVLVGRPARELNIFAKDNKTDLIVTGKRGISGLKKIVMGSVSKKLTNEAACPVLVIK